MCKTTDFQGRYDVVVWGVSVSLNLTVSLCAVLRRSQIAVLAIADWERFCANVSVEMVGTRSREAGQQPRHRVSAYMEDTIDDIPPHRVSTPAGERGVYPGYAR